MDNKANRGRKFAVIILVAILTGIGMAAGLLAALHGADTAWLTTTMPVLVGTFPAYMGANAVQKAAQAKNQNNQKPKEVMK